MNTCPARPKVKKTFWVFSWEQGQEHEFSFWLHWRHFWWKIDWHCVHCGASYEEWPIDDFKLMRKLNLKKCPEHNAFALLTDKDDLIEQGCY